MSRFVICLLCVLLVSSCGGRNEKRQELDFTQMIPAKPDKHIFQMDIVFGVMEL